MSFRHSTLRAGSLALPVVRAACAATPRGASPSPALNPAPSGERIGVFAPLEPSTIAIWPETWHGELLLLEVAPHGKLVEQGEVLARFYKHAFDEELWQADLEAESAVIRHAALLERGKLEELGARSMLEHAKAESERAERALEGWKRFELDFAHRSDEIQRQYTGNGVEDQQDELKQIQKMYEADELVTATEDIVIKRSRRALALSQVNQKLQQEQQKYRDEFERAKETQVREETARMQREAYERLAKTQAIDARCGRVVLIHETLCVRCGTELYYPETDEEILPPQMPVRG